MAWPLKRLADTRDASWRTSNPVAYALRRSFFISIIPFALAAELACVAVALIARDMLGYPFDLAFGLCSGAITAMVYLSWRILVSERRLDYRYVFSARSIYRFRNIALAVLSVVALHLLNGLFSDPLVYAASLCCVLVAAAEAHTSLRDHSGKAGDLPDMLGVLFVFFIPVALVLAAFGAAEAYLVNRYGKDFGLLFIVDIVGLLIACGVVWRYFHAVGRMSRRRAGLFQTALAPVIALALVLIGVLIVQFTDDRAHLIAAASVLFAVGMLLLDLVFAVGEPTVFGPD